jgi:hypothetical protein
MTNIWSLPSKMAPQARQARELPIGAVPCRVPSLNRYHASRTVGVVLQDDDEPTKPDAN